MAFYRLSERADHDFESIYLFGLLSFGLSQADSYTDGMIERFEQIAAQPELYPAVEHIKPGYRLSVYHSHSIYYKMDGADVLVVRILRNQDIGAAFSVHDEN